MLEFETFSPEETLAIAGLLGSKLKGGEVIALEGELGAGKTLFVKGLAQGLGVEEPVTSPTFTLIHQYEGKIPLTHFDVYRLPSPESLEELGYEEFFYGSGVTAVEWSDLIRAYLPREYLLISIRRTYRPNKGEGRQIRLEPHGPSLEKLVEEMKEYACLRN